MPAAPPPGPPYGAPQGPPPGPPPGPPVYPGQPPVYPGYVSAPPATGYGMQPGIVLPPGTELASAGKRIGTYFLEIVLVIVTLVIGYLIWMLILWGRGQTPGKRIMGMRIYHLQNQRAASWGQMFLRQFVGGIVNGIFYIGLIVSVVFLFTDPLRRTVPDRIAGTIELNDPNNVLEPRK
jgi:uncharacterized RDD family membrane protein YckC